MPLDGEFMVQARDRSNKNRGYGYPFTIIKMVYSFFFLLLYVFEYCITIKYIVLHKANDHVKNWGYRERRKK